MRLQFVEILKLQFGQTFAAQFTVTPSVLRRFVAAQMKIFRRKQIAYFVQNIADKIVR